MQGPVLEIVCVYRFGEAPWTEATGTMSLGSSLAARPS